jgi:large conductance mechanosensitive channel protein
MTRKKPLKGFMDFVRKQGVVGLAVGLAIGAQASELVKNIVSSVITPIVDLIVGQGGLNGLDTTVNIAGRSTVFQFGLLIDSLLKFLAVALVIYFVVIGLSLDKLDKKEE